MTNKKIIGTGLSGLVGSRIVELLGNEYEFIDFSINTQVNIMDFQMLSNAFEANKDADVVLHLAAFTDTNAAWLQRGDKSGLCYDLNVNGTQHVLDLCQKHNKYLINISTDFVFDGTKEGKYTEEDKPNPIEWYGETKYLAESLIVNSNHNAAVARISFPYRANFEHKKDLVRKAIDAMKAGTLNPMFTDQITTPTFCDDIAFGIKYLIENQPKGIFHIVGSSSQSPFDMVQKIAAQFGFDPSIVKPSSLDEYIKNLPPGSRPWQKNLAISNEKITNLGIKMKTLDEGLTEMKCQISG
jgi:dTDP-4-dehydrorhamnose reductase